MPGVGEPFDANAAGPVEARAPEPVAGRVGGDVPTPTPTLVRATRRTVPFWALGVVALVAGLAGAGVHAAASAHSATPRVLHGSIVGSNVSGTAIIFREDGETGPPGEGRSYGLDTRTWIDRDGGTHQGDGLPACVVPLSTVPAPADLAVVDVSDGSGAGSYPVVVWVRCR
jgi:hypothetical protein